MAGVWENFYDPKGRMQRGTTPVQVRKRIKTATGLELVLSLLQTHHLPKYVLQGTHWHVGDLLDGMG